MKHTSLTAPCYFSLADNITPCSSHYFTDSDCINCFHGYNACDQARTISKARRIRVRWKCSLRKRTAFRVRQSYNGENYSVSYVERPPVFWWLLTSLFSIGVQSIQRSCNISTIHGSERRARRIVCLRTLSGLEVRTFAGILAGLSGFAISIGSHILSDAMGSFLAALAMFSFYEYVFKNRRWFALISGASIGLGLDARDEDLVTLVLMIVLLIIFVPKGGVTRKILYLMVLGTIVGIPVLLYGEISTMQLISNLATPIVFDWWPVIVAIGAFLTFLAYKSTNRTQITELGAAFFGFFVIMLPFFQQLYAWKRGLLHSGKGNPREAFGSFTDDTTNGRGRCEPDNDSEDDAMARVNTGSAFNPGYYLDSYRNLLLCKIKQEELSFPISLDSRDIWVRGRRYKSRGSLPIDRFCSDYDFCRNWARLYLEGKLPS